MIIIFNLIYKNINLNENRCQWYIFIIGIIREI
jgi:hypothetical protein